MKVPKGHTAVMAQRAATVIEADDDTRAMWRRLEYFPTPPWAARACGEVIQALDPGKWWAWEPACGFGHMAWGLRDYFEAVHATDVHDHGGPLQHGPPLDFLDPAADLVDCADWIVTNPPFVKAAEFVQAGLRRARRGVAILARTALLESATRYPLFFGETPLYALAPFFERVPMELGGWNPRGSTATAYALFIWMRPGVLPERTGALGERPMIWPIAPGARARLARADDARRFGRFNAAPLLDGADG